MGQCVSSGSASANNNKNNNNSGGGNITDKPSSRCQAPGCQNACDPGSRSRYCAQHAVCRRQGCARPRHRKGPYCQEHLHTCRASRCSNEQVRVYDARFTNRLCWDHQPTEVREAWVNGTLFPEYGTAGADATDQQQQHQHQQQPQRTRRRRSRQKPNPIMVAEVAPAPVYEPPVYISETPASDSDDDESDVRDAGHQLSTIGEDAEVAPPPAKSPRAPRPETAPGTPTARRSHKTVHFAEPPPRASSPEKHQAVASDVWAPADSVSSASATRLRTSRHRRSVDGGHGSRSSPKASGSGVTPATHNREKRKSTSSVPSKSADAKRPPRPRSRP